MAVTTCPKNARRGFRLSIGLASLCLNVFSMNFTLAMTCIAIVRSLLDSGYAGKDRGGIAVTLQARGHGEFGNLSEDVHILHVTMAIRTVDPSIDMRTMIEIRVVRNSVNPLPRKGDPLFKIPGELDDFGFVLACDGVTIHADGECGNGGVG